MSLEISLACGHCRHLGTPDEVGCHSLQESGSGPWQVVAGEMLTGRFWVLSKGSLTVGVAVLLASSAPPFKMAWSLYPSRTQPGCVSGGSRGPLLGEPNQPVPKTPARFNCPSFNHTHTPHTSTYYPLTPLLTCSHSLQFC